jgi:hypothetical protein
MPTLTTPYREQGPAWLEVPGERYKLKRGVSLLVTGETVTEKQYPSQDEAEDADFFYQGGMIHVITDDEAATLTDAGYGAYIT